MTYLPKSPAVAIVGGGFTGTAIAYHLVRSIGIGAARIVVVEPRSWLGGGLAYSTPDAAHRVNVPASRMSIDPGEPAHFEDWLTANGAVEADRDAITPDGRIFPHRSVFGRYMREQIAPVLSSGRVAHIQARVLRIEQRQGGYRLSLSTGDTLSAGLVVIATSHPPPSPPPTLMKVLAGDSRFVTDATRPNALASIKGGQRVLIVGTGLTMADIVASLDHRGHQARIVAVSRRGLLSRGHGDRAYPNFGDFTGSPVSKTRDLVRVIRSTLRDAEAQQMPWQPVFDALRNQGREIWAALSLDERRRLVRHLRPFWDAHRFRVAPQVEEVLRRRKESGTFEVLAGSIADVSKTSGEIAVLIRLRRSGKHVVRKADAAAIATGPGHRDILTSEPYLGRLERDGLVCLDEVGLGLAVNRRGRAIGRNGHISDTLLIGGPLARGTFGELMGLPEVARYAVDIAGEIAQWLARAEAAIPAIMLAG